MEVNSFQILLIDVTFYLYHVYNVVHKVLIKYENPNIGPMRHRRLKSLKRLMVIRGYIEYKMKCLEQTCLRNIETIYVVC